MGKKILIMMPLILGIISIFMFMLYFYSANHAPYKYTDAIIVGPFFSLAGIIISVVTRRSRKIYPALWGSGIVTCLFGFIVCIFVIVLMILIVAAASNGTWL